MLEVNELTKGYGQKQILKGVNFTLNSGDLKCLIGVNGAGKTTLIECICGVKKINSGAVFINGLNVFDKKNKNHIKKKIWLYATNIFNV